MAQHLLVVSDLRRTLREEERAAWQRLLRVMGHEVKNSLTPIRSIAGTVRSMIGRGALEPAQREAAMEGLEVIEQRSGSLDRFLAQYRQLAHPMQMEVATRSPVLKPWTFSPKSATSPDSSWPMMSFFFPGLTSWKIRTTLPQMPTARTRTVTS